MTGSRHRRRAAVVPLTLAVLLGAAPAWADGDALGPPSHALYPIWEDTGSLLAHRRAYLGWGYAGFGIAGVAEVGLNPSALVLRVPNVGVKVSLVRRDRLWVAARASYLDFLPGASEGFVAKNYTSSWENPDFSVHAVPVSISTTARPLDWITLHHTVTALGVAGGEQIEDKVTIGNFASAEVAALRGVTFALHAGETGLWDHQLFVIGASARYTRGWFQAGAGYFYRFGDSGRQAQPLFDLGVRL